MSRWDDERRDDRRTDGELFDTALVELDLDGDDPAYTRALGTLWWRSTPDILDRARALAASDEPPERCLAVLVLGNLTTPSSSGDFHHRSTEFVEETLAVLLPLTESEEDVDVLCALANALSQRADPRTLDALVALSAHADEDVRLAAVQGLPFADVTAEDEDQPTADEQAHTDRLVAALMTRCDDEDGDVRDWALFGLQSTAVRLVPEDPLKPERRGVRETFAAHLDDEHHDAREEAIAGLASMGDPRAFAPLLGELTHPELWPSMCTLDAVAAFGDPRLLPALLDLQSRGCDVSGLDDAIAACRGGAG